MDEYKHKNLCLKWILGKWYKKDKDNRQQIKEIQNAHIKSKTIYVPLWLSSMYATSNFVWFPYACQKKQKASDMWVYIKIYN